MSTEDHAVKTNEAEFNKLLELIQAQTKSSLPLDEVQAIIRYHLECCLVEINDAILSTEDEKQNERLEDERRIESRDTDGI